LSGVLAKVDAITKSANEISVYEDRERSLTKKIDALMPEIEDKRLLEALAKAYSAKGIKAQRANEICSLLEQNLNTYSNLIFCEPFVFSVSATESGMSILVDRGNGHVSDVRNLSGAESNAFRLLYVMSSLPLTPDAQRVNMLTLDEPCAHMDEIARTKFLRMFLPALSEIVPNIFIITPNPSDYCEGAKQWIVRKERGKSTVVQDAVPYDSPADAAKILAKAQRAIGGGRKTKQRQKPGMVA
jgi:wobble nucleotide-excising tRNase